MKKQFLKTILPVMLLVTAVFIIGSGCSNGNSNPLYTYFLDSDGDGFGDPDFYVQESNQPVGYVQNATDCDDSNAAIYPGAIEVPDNLIDEDCNGLHAFTFYKDEDMDGFGGTTEVVVEVVIGDAPPSGIVTNNADCNDTDADVNPRADEIVGNGIDDNCDGYVDFFEIYTDADGDGYGAGNVLPPPAVGVHNNLDCDDTDADVYPYAFEIYDNGIDDNCDGVIDELY